MIDGIEEFYQQIAESMVQAIPEEWSSASFEATFFPDSSTYEAEYARKSDGKARGFQPTSSGSRAFRQLRKRFQETGKPLWGKARFDLRPDGTFNMKWDYEGCDENGNALFDEEAELLRSRLRQQRLTAG